MNTTLKNELISHMKDYNNGDKNHFTMFNEDYYLIGYHNCNEWLKKHDIDIFEGLQFVSDCERFHFGENLAEIKNSEQLVNNIVYWVGYELCIDLEIPFDRE